MSIKKLVTTLLALATIITCPQLKADAAGLNLSADGPNIHYLRPNIEYTQKWASWLGLHQQRSYIMTSQESHSRNILMSASAQLLNHVKTFPGNKHTLNPKLEVLVGKLFKHNTMALGGGGIYQIPKGEIEHLPGDLTIDFFVTPKLTTFGSGTDYLWGLSIQADFPLPENNQLNIGLRKFKAMLDKEGRQPIEQGLYIGLTTLF